VHFISFFVPLQGDEEYREIFNSLMLELVDELEPACQEAGHVFVTSVSRLLERLLGQ
jgi:dedicator of cytokinesis protein 3